MNVRQVPTLKHFIVVLFLLTGLSSQLQVVFACDLMDELPTTVCCCGDDMANGCEMGGGCNMDGEMALNPDCCDVSFDSLSDITLGAPTSTSSLVALQNAAQPPLSAMLCTIISRPQPVSGGGPLLIYHHADGHFDGNEVYLVTKRLRI